MELKVFFFGVKWVSILNLKMTTDCTGDAAFDMLQPERDLRLNWEVDLAQNLERYLLQICSGEFQCEDENTVNFAEGEVSLLL